MNNTIGLSQLITRLAKLTDTDTATARRFLRTLFATVEEALIQGEEVNIKGIGTFRRSTDSAFGSATGVIFIPDEKLAAEVNAPFAIFEPVELADGVDFSEQTLPASEAQPEPEPVQEPVAEPIPEATSEPEPEPVSLPEPEPEIETVTSSADVYEVVPKTPRWPEEEEAEAEANDEQPTAESTDEAHDEEPEPAVTAVYTSSALKPADDEPAKSNRTLWIGAALAIVAACVLGYMCAVYIPDDSVSDYDNDLLQNTPAPQIEEVSVEELTTTADTEAAETATADTETVTAPTSTTQPEVAPQAPAVEKPKAPRRDTVTATRFLATMAREYYGKGIYWVYIYQANKDILDNPNRIQPGTVVVIPDKSSFAAPTEQETLREAERIQAELFKKYK